MNATEATVATYGIGQLTRVTTGTMKKFVDSGKLHHTQYIHRVWMNGLKPGITYCTLGLIFFNTWFTDFFLKILRSEEGKK